jgi:hypothetical protein
MLAASHVDAGISMHYSGHSHHSGKSFNFAVSSTTPTMLGSNPDSPSEPVLDSFFPRLLELRDFSGFGAFARFQAPTMMGGGGGVGRGPGRFDGVKPGGSGMGGNSGGGGGGSAGLPNGSNTTSGGQPVNGTGGIVCGTDPGGSAGGDPDDGSGGTDGGGGSPNPSAVPEPSSFALWSLVTCMLIFGTRRVARRR